LSAGARVDVVVTGNWTALHWAASDGLASHATLLAILIQNGASVEALTDRGESVLHLAAKKGFAADVQALLNAGADACAVDGAGSSVLHAAATSGNGEVLQTLWAAGARDVSAQCNGAWTPLHCAVHANKLTAVEWLLSRGALLHAKTLSGRTPLDIAREMRHDQIVDCLRAVIGSQFRG
jgi:ankyrin repeat protein